MQATIEDPIGKRQLLAELGLEENWLLEAVSQGMAEWARCTNNHPKLYKGVTFWGETVKGLRDQLIPHGWKRSDEGNLPFTVNEAGDLAIAVATGDISTGTQSMPSTKSAKGQKTRDAVNTNQLRLFNDDAELPVAIAAIRNRRTWILLAHRDSEKREVRCELSLPVGMADDGHINGWDRRIILDSIPFDGDVVSIDNTTPGAPDIDIQIKKRG
jgi:hypothetical protein